MTLDFRSPPVCCTTFKIRCAAVEKIIYSIICENEDVNINSIGKFAVKSTDAVLLCSHGDWLSQGTSRSVS